MAEQLRHYLATLGGEVTLILNNSNEWHNSPALGQADLIMGDRLFGEAPEFTLELWLRWFQICPLVLFGPAFSHLEATLVALLIKPIDKDRRAAVQHVFANLMDDATLTPLCNYHYRISAPPGGNGVRLTPRGWVEFSDAWLPP
ncbi:SgrR family transcriptional regulator, partial [Salmonella enterica subsp. enterica serovar Kentucky]